MRSRWLSECPTGSAQHASGQQDDCLDQFEYAFHRDSQDAEGQQQQPHQGIQDESNECQWPAEDQDDDPKEEGEHDGL